MDNPGFEIFGQYLLLNRIACGGMAEIYLARPASANANGRISVVKRILPHVTDDPTFIKMFRSETQVCMGFNHPNLVQIHDFGHVGSHPYIAMEYVEGKNLRELTSKFTHLNKKVPVGVAASIVAQAAAGLHYAHTFRNHVTGEALRIIHRDISPQNIIVSYDGNVKIIDFGIAKAELEFADKTSTGSIKGKVSYLSPEQLRMEELDGRSDVFSLGAVFWEILTGRKLFHLLGRSDIEVMGMIANCDKTVKAPSSINPEVPPALDEIVLKALALDREDRYPSAEAFQEALRKFLFQEVPGFSYRDVGAQIKAAFQEEVIEERMYVQVLNSKAQESLLNDQATRLTNDVSSFTSTRQTVDSPSHSGSNLVGQPQPKMGTDSGLRSTTYQVPHPMMPGMAAAERVMIPQKIKEQFYIKLTVGRAIALLVYVATIIVLRMDHEQTVMASIFGKAPDASDYLREASLDARQVHPSQKSAHAKGNENKRAPASMPASILLRINVIPQEGVVPTGISINQFPVNLENPVVRVLLDRELSIKVDGKGAKPLHKKVRLNSLALNGVSYYSLDIPLQRP